MITIGTVSQLTRDTAFCGDSLVADQTGAIRYRCLDAANNEVPNVPCWSDATKTVPLAAGSEVGDHCG